MSKSFEASSGYNNVLEEELVVTQETPEVHGSQNDQLPVYKQRLEEVRDKVKRIKEEIKSLILSMGSEEKITAFLNKIEELDFATEQLEIQNLHVIFLKDALLRAIETSSGSDTIQGIQEELNSSEADESALIDLVGTLNTELQALMEESGKAKEIRNRKDELAKALSEEVVLQKGVSKIVKDLANKFEAEIDKEILISDMEKKKIPEAPPVTVTVARSLIPPSAPKMTQSPEVSASPRQMTAPKEDMYGRPIVPTETFSLDEISDQVKQADVWKAQSPISPSMSESGTAKKDFRPEALTVENLSPEQRKKLYESLQRNPNTLKSTKTEEQVKPVTVTEAQQALEIVLTKEEERDLPSLKNFLEIEAKIATQEALTKALESIGSKEEVKEAQELKKQNSEIETLMKGSELKTVEGLERYRLALSEINSRSQGAARTVVGNAMKRIYRRLQTLQDAEAKRKATEAQRKRAENYKAVHGVPDRQSGPVRKGNIPVEAISDVHRGEKVDRNPFK